jgi:hypothetical protein
LDPRTEQNLTPVDYSENKIQIYHVMTTWVNMGGCWLDAQTSFVQADSSEMHLIAVEALHNAGNMHEALVSNVYAHLVLICAVLFRERTNKQR